ncbi:MAG: hypothetical protein WCT06_08840 [Armatimonadota bacterium]
MIFPWTDVEGQPLIETEQWMKASLLSKGIPLKYVREPDEVTVKRIESIFTYLSGSRNFILIVSNRTAYVSSLFYYLASTWLVNTAKQFEIIDLTKMQEDDTLLYKMEQTSLLMIPFNDSDNYKLRGVRNALGAMLIRRQVKNLPTIIELYIKQPPSNLKDKELLGLLKNLASLYGDPAASTFMDKNSNVKLLKLG